MNADNSLSQDQKTIFPVNSRSKPAKSAGTLKNLCREDTRHLDDETNFLTTFSSIAASQSLPKQIQCEPVNSSGQETSDHALFLGRYAALLGIASGLNPVLTGDVSGFSPPLVELCGKNSLTLDDERFPAFNPVFLTHDLTNALPGTVEQDAGQKGLHPLMQPGKLFPDLKPPVVNLSLSGSAQGQNEVVDSHPFGCAETSETTPVGTGLLQANKLNHCRGELFSQFLEGTGQGSAADYGKPYASFAGVDIFRETTFPKAYNLSGNPDFSAQSGLVPDESLLWNNGKATSEQAAAQVSRNLVIKEEAGGKAAILQAVRDLTMESGGCGADYLNKKATKIGADKGEYGFWLPGNLSEKLPQGPVASKETAPFQSPLENAVLTQIVEKAIINLKNGQTFIKIKLRPEFLGPLKMHIFTENHQVMVRILTDVPWVKETIEQNIDQLRAALQNHGMQMDKFDVSVSTNPHSHSSYGGEQRTPSSVNLGGDIDEQDLHKGLHEELDAIGYCGGATNDLGTINYFI